MLNVNEMFSEFLNIINNISEQNLDEYLSNIDKYKNIIDRTPNKFLKFHLDDSIKKEWFELAHYIKETANKRNFKIN